jgi:carboxyl-terminal processing protease
MRAASVLVLTLALSSCSLIDVGGSDRPEATPVDDFSEGCTGVIDDIVLLCQAVELIDRNYVDDVAHPDLVESALDALEPLPPGEADEELQCAVDDDVAAPICDEIDSRELDPDVGVETALSAMAFSLDPHSAYLDPVALEMATDETQGRVEGIGALVNAEDQTASDPVSAQCGVLSETCRLTIASTFEGSPAREAGVLPGDFIVEVNGQDVTGLQIDEVTELVRGPAGSTVEITFERGGERIVIAITRQAIDIPVATWEMVDDVGYLRLNLFTVNSDDQVEEALTELLGAGARGIVLDLRDNPGGALQASIEVTSEFLAEGLVVITEAPDETREYEVTGDGLATDTDVAIWIVVNGGSASASEVTSGALRDAGRATILGENTFGKNTVQQRFDLANGGAMKLTIARWTTPSGTDFGAVGITPDVESDFGPDLTPTDVVRQVLELVE